MPIVKPESEFYKPVQFRCESTEEVELFRAAADATGLPPSTWYRERALRAAGSTVLADALLAEAVERGTVQRGRAADREPITTTSVLFRLPPDEHAFIMEAIERSGLSQAKWLRTVYRSSAGDKRLQKENAELMALFSRLQEKPRRMAGARR